MRAKVLTSTEASAPRDPKHVAQEVLGPREQGRVLLVADDTNEVAPYRELLEKSGVAVVGVVGGAAALVEQRRSRPHVIIAHVNIRGISAKELAATLLSSQDGVPLVLVGREAATTVRRGEALAAGAFDYFSLPTDIPLLVARVEQLVELKKSIDALRAEADRDFLTGLSNRRRFRQALEGEVERWRRYNVPCALILIDIDHLKHVNDTHGHAAGDTAIRHVAQNLASLSRDNDTAARLGGEEFALLLAGVSSDRAALAAERLRHSVASTPVDGVGSVTISLGVASCPTHAVTERALYSASDAALYTAKNGGRNRFVIAPVPHSSAA